MVFGERKGTHFGFHVFKCIYLQRGGGKERDIDLFLHLPMHSSVDSCMCSDPGAMELPTFVYGNQALTTEQLYQGRSTHS